MVDIKTVEQKYAKEFDDIMDYIFNHPELGNEEFESSAFLVEKLREWGFQVTYPYGPLKTSFRAEYKKGEGAHIAFLPEYDALYGYGDQHDQKAHACGHHFIAASTLGACRVLMDLDIEGTIVCIGTPAEETTGGKVDLVKFGAFDDIDAAFQLHLGKKTNLNVTTLAMDSLEFNYYGKAAHAAAYPHLGVNALDGVHLLFDGINCLRQQLQSDVRIHGNVTDGGQAINTIPAFAQARYYIRSAHRSYLNEVLEKVKNCGKGAALMCGAQLEIKNFENSYDELHNVMSLQKEMATSLQTYGFTNIIYGEEESSGSSDIGNVSQVCPTMYGEVAIWEGCEAGAHEESFIIASSSKKAHDTLHNAICSLCDCARKLYRDENLLNRIKEEWKKA